MKVDVLEFVDSLRENPKALKDFMSTMYSTLSRNKLGQTLNKTFEHPSSNTVDLLQDSDSFQNRKLKIINKN